MLDESHLSEHVQRLDVGLEVSTEEQVKQGLGHTASELILQLINELVARRDKVPLENLSEFCR